jgi:hypothetical protein
VLGGSVSIVLEVGEGFAAGAVGERCRYGGRCGSVAAAGKSGGCVGVHFLNVTLGRLVFLLGWRFLFWNIHSSGKR